MWEIVFFVSGLVVLWLRSVVVNRLKNGYKTSPFIAILLRIYSSLVIYSFVGRLLCNINAEETYTWYSGIWHGLFFLPNLVRHWLFDAEFKAEYCTTAYNVFFWIFGILTTLKFIEYDARFMNRLYDTED